jgi:hypothetical protein
MDPAPLSSQGSVARHGSAPLIEALERDLEALGACGDRRPARAGHEAARTLLARRLREAGASPYVGDEFVAPYGSGYANVLALVPGGDRHRRRLLLATRYDAATASCRDVAAIAVALAVVELLQRAGLERGVLVAFLDDGAPPRYRDTLTGASILLGEQLRHELKAAVVLDRLGTLGEAPLVPGGVFVAGAESDARLPPLLEAAARGVPLAPIHRRYRAGIPASAPYRDASLPYLELFGPRPARAALPQGADAATLVDLAGFVTRLLAHLDEARLPGPFEGFESASFEARSLAAALAPHPEAASTPGTSRSHRQEVDAMVRQLGQRLAP